MIIVIIIFFVSIILAFGVLSFRVWEMSKESSNIDENSKPQMPELYFRHIEKYMLYWTKRIVQWIVLTIVKYWLIAVTKIKNWLSAKWPKVHSIFKKKEKSLEPVKISFVRRAVLESKVKIRKMKEKIKEQHSDNNTNTQETEQ